MYTKKESHLKHVDSIPDGCIPITKFGKHEFKDLYFCQSKFCLYQKFMYRIREIPLLGENGEKVPNNVRTIDGKSIPIPALKLSRIIEKGEFEKINPDYDKK